MVQNALKSLSIHQPISVWDGSVSIFPEHCRSHSGILDHLAVLYSKIPEHAHSVGELKPLLFNIFRSIPVHYFYLWDYLCVRDKLRYKGVMAGVITDMSKIKQVLIMHKNGISNRQIAKG